MTEIVWSPDTLEFEAAKKAQSDAARPTQSAWVEANAGSGKTKVLIDRVARLLLRQPDGRPGAAPDSILCITYTKAAANEMLARLFSRLGDWAVATDESLRDSLSRLEGRPPNSYTDEDFREARRLFARALETPGGLRIETIHAFCARILRRFPLEASVAPRFKAIEEDEADRLWRAVLASGLEQAVSLKPEAMTVLSQATGGLGVGAALDALKFKREALQGFNRSASTEKERTQKIQMACGAGDAVREDLLVQAMQSEFPHASINRARQALLQLEKPGKADANLLYALTTLEALSDPEERFTVYMNAIAGSKWDFPSGSNPYTAKAGKEVADLFSRNLKSDAPEGREITRMKQVQSALQARALADRSIALMQLGLPVIEAYNREKRARGALDFDDLIARTHALLTQSSAAEWVLYKLDGGISHLLLDEAQDTSPSQWALINAIVAEFQTGLGRERAADPRTQFVVGDPKQSIYSFQGADQQKFEAEKQGFLRREQVIADEEDRAINLPEMAMSFRSTPEVLSFVDEVRAQVPLWKDATDPLPPREADLASRHAARRANQAGRVELWPLELPLPQSEEATAWTTPTDHVPADAPRRRLAGKVARSVRQMIDRGDAVWKEQPDRSWKRQAIEPQDILILVRSRNDLFDALIESLKQENIPVAGADRLRLLDNIGVQDCLNLLRFALQPGDDLTLAEILRGPFCGLTDDDKHLFVLAYGRPKGATLWDQLRATTEPAFAQAQSFCERLLAHRDLPAFEYLTRALTERLSDGLSGWDRLIQRLGEPVRDPVQSLLSGALGYDMSKARSLQAFLAEIEQQNAVLKRELGEPEGAVRVMTVHGAKGLQSPLVILPDTTGATKPVSEAVFATDEGVPLYSPSSRTDAAMTAQLRTEANAAAERESRRLLYVALTRASDRLIIAGAGMANAKAGYAKSSWYRWCLVSMRACLGLDASDEAGAEPLCYGPEIPAVARARPVLEASKSTPDWLKRMAPAPQPPQRLAAPSRLSEDQSTVLKPFGAARSAALRRGRLIHGLLQTLPELATDIRQAAGQAYLAKEPELSEAERREMLDAAMHTLEHPEFSQIFSKDGRSEAAIVGKLMIGTPAQERLVNGRVDRLIIRSDQILIVDYKTDRPAPETAQGVEFSYRVQMAAYRAVLQDIYPDRPVRCALLYTDGPRLIELEGDDMSESLNRVRSRV